MNISSSKFQFSIPSSGSGYAGSMLIKVGKKFLLNIVFTSEQLGTEFTLTYKKVKYEGIFQYSICYLRKFKK